MKVIYIIMFMSLWTLGTFFLIHRDRTNTWAGLTVLLGGTASFTFAMHLSIMPYIADAKWLNPELSHALYVITVIAITIYFYLLPYVFCMGGLWLAEHWSKSRKLFLSIMLLSGPVTLLSIHFVTENWNSFDIGWFRWWQGAYIAVGSLFFILAFRGEHDPYNRRSKRRVAIIFPLAIIWAFETDFVGFKSLQLGMWSFDLQSNGAWQTNFIVILGTIAAILYYIIKTGFLGIKLRIERERLDYSMRALTMGVSILNHTIKNEIQKVDYLAEKSSKQFLAGEAGKAVITIAQVHDVTAHLMHMVNRIKDKADDIMLDESLCDVRSMIESVIESAQRLGKAGSVAIHGVYEVEGQLYCDLVHVKETLSNLIHNAMDALPEHGGQIQIHIVERRKEFRIDVIDNGQGIPKANLEKIFEPFFTTKKNTVNYGLGLAYCLNIMIKHGGRLTVQGSMLGRGTTVALHFPARRFKISVRHEKAKTLTLGVDNISPS